MNSLDSTTKSNPTGKMAIKSNSKCKDCTFKWNKRKTLLKNILWLCLKDWKNNSRKNNNISLRNTIATSKKSNSYKASERIFARILKDTPRTNWSINAKNLSAILRFCVRKDLNTSMKIMHSIPCKYSSM